MRDLYASSAAALRDALRHAVEKGGVSSLRVLHQGAPSPVMLAGTDATVQSARIRRQLDRLGDVPRALLVLAYAPQVLKCSCGARCCSGSYPNPESAAAMRVVLAHVAPLLAGRGTNDRLRAAIVANALTRTKETTVSLAQRYGVDRHTVGTYIGIIEAELIGNRHAPGRLDAACERIDALLREAGIVADDARARAA